MTKAELKRRLTPGTELTLVNCLMGPCLKPRIVKEARTKDYIMLTPEGTNSYLAISVDEEIRETSGGFQVVIKAQPATVGMPEQSERIAAEYVWGTGPACTCGEGNDPKLGHCDGCARRIWSERNEALANGPTNWLVQA